MNEPPTTRSPDVGHAVTPAAVLEQIAELRTASERLRTALDHECLAARNDRVQRAERWKELHDNLFEISVCARRNKRASNKKELAWLMLAVLSAACCFISSARMIWIAWTAT